MSLPSEEPLPPPMRDELRLSDDKSQANGEETQVAEVPEPCLLPPLPEETQRSPKPQPCENAESQASSADATQVEPRIADIIRVLANEKKEARVVQMPESTSSTTQPEPRVAEFIRARANEGGTAADTWVTARSHLSTTETEPRVAEFIRAQANKEAGARDIRKPSKVLQVLKLQATHMSIEDIPVLLVNAALSTEDARILIHSNHGYHHDMRTDPAITRLPAVHGREVFAVSQTIQDVDFNVKFLTPISLQFQIIYDPGSDDCLFVNESSVGIQLSRSTPPHISCVVRKKKSQSVQPGIWRVAADREGDSCDVFEFLLNERLFNVSIHEANISVEKRSADTDAEKSAKRQRLANNTMAEVIDTQTASGLTTESGSTDADITSSREIVNKDAVPLLDLKDRETAAIKALYGTNTGTYRLQRIVLLGATRNTSVFSCRHSGIPKRRLVVKVLRYDGSRVPTLPTFARLWKTEKSMLEMVKHRNIVALEAFDGRMLAIYLEVLPLSLNRGVQSPFTQFDAHRILLDMSSALSYLANQRMVHNDIKPANIAYSPQRGAVLFDFGMACSIDKGPKGGTPWYLPPELIRENARGLPGDIWAMGITMLYVLQKINIPETIAKGWNIWELPPHVEGGSAKAQMRSWLKFVATKRAELDRKDRAEEAVFQMLRGKPELRATAGDVEEALRATIDG